MEIRRRQRFGLAVGEPPGARKALAVRRYTGKQRKAKIAIAKLDQTRKAASRAK